MFTFLEATSETYQGHFDEFTITQTDRLEVSIYRGSMLVAAIAFAMGSSLVLIVGPQPYILTLLTGLLLCFILAIGISLATIHIYMRGLHRLLQYSWAIGSLFTAYIGITQTEPLLATVYHQPRHLLGMGWLFVALTGIYFKEAFCFNHAETKLLTGVVPVLLIGHLLSWLPVGVEQGLLAAWASLFLIFAIRKITKPIPPDIGDKSVFEYLQHQRRQPQSTDFEEDQTC
ncbi:DUF2301 domain-containing membrane protein [Acaryochloris sp. IP29b_bin.137]|uniref:DUF2301 domain-containing membrane protein n=1 Tax=Acaryochloris sp. IP29b_bin.137 TaxID=2969217 RepID=UPI00261E4AB7|nr:DUF2301 domain-containing membrane protein [Acaryochloris sp. IP29b_bin.137]